MHLIGAGRQGGRWERWCVAASELDETQVAGAEEGPTSWPRDGERRGTRMCVERLGTGSCGNGHLNIREVQRLVTALDHKAISWADLYATCEGCSPTGILARI